METDEDIVFGLQKFLEVFVVADLIDLVGLGSGLGQVADDHQDGEEVFHLGRRHVCSRKDGGKSEHKLRLG